MTEEKITILAVVALNVLFLVPVFYFLVYKPSKHYEWATRGRAMARAIHGGFIFNTIMVVTVYLLYPAIFTGDTSMLAMLDSIFGVTIPMGALFQWLILPYRGSVAVRYDVFFVRAQLAAGAGKLYLAVMWWLGLGVSDLIVYMLFGIAMINLIATEILFLRRNEGRLMPDRPK